MSLQIVTAATKLKDTCSVKEKLFQPRQHIKRERHYFADKGPSSQSYGFSSSHVWMWELDHKEIWAPKNWCFWTVILEKILESPLDCKEIQPVHPKGNQSWILNGRTDAEAEAPILWLPDAKSWLTGKDPGAGTDWRREVKGTTEDEMVGWHHWLNGRDWASSGRWWRTGKPGVLQSMGSQIDMTERLNNKCYITALGGAICLLINIHNAGTCLDAQFPNPWASCAVTLSPLQTSGLLQVGFFLTPTAHSRVRFLIHLPLLLGSVREF